MALDRVAYRKHVFFQGYRRVTKGKQTFGSDYDDTVEAELGQEARLSQEDVGLWCRHTLGSSFDC